jgi:hypothetical protein
MYIKATKKRHLNFNNFAHSIICSIFAETIIKDLTDGAYAPKRAQAIFPNSPTFFPYTLLIIKHT